MKRLAVLTISAFVMSSVGFTSLGLAEDLSNAGVFHRCYAQLTQRRVPLSSPVLAQVRAGTKDPIAACLEVLDSAKFVAPDFVQINVANTVAKDVLRTMHHLHSSWFENKDFIAIGQLARTESTRAALDITAPASYYTKALFDPNMKVSDVLTTTQNLSPRRSIMVPTASDVPPILYSVYPAGFPFVPVGDILGVYNRTGIRSPASATTKGDVSLSMGGGILGNQSYLMSTVNATSQFRADGAIKMPRKWARSVYSDLLCRELPVVRQDDGIQFIDANADGPFRRSAACVHCHASIDRMSGVIRGFSYIDAGGGEHDAYGYFANTILSTGVTSVASGNQTWLSAGSQNFARGLPAVGVLYYRDYNGTLIDMSVSGIAELGTKISQYDDFYICAAKRYYEYFLGVNAQIGDLNDPGKKVVLNAAENLHRNNVIKLGLNLKQHQRLRDTIAEIIRMPAYKKSNFNRGSTTP